MTTQHMTTHAPARAAPRLSDRTGFRLAIYELMRLFDEAVNIPLALGMLITGLVVSLRGKWGLLRHWWVTVKLALSLLVPIATFLLSVPRVQSMCTESASETNSTCLYSVVMPFR